MANQKGLIDAIDFYYNRQTAIDFINNLMKLSQNMMMIYCLTTSMRDFYYNEDQMYSIKLEKEKKYMNLFNYIKKFKYNTKDLEETISLNIR